MALIKLSIANIPTTMVSAARGAAVGTCHWRAGVLLTINNIDAGWNVYESVTGTDLPLFVIIETGKSRAEFAAQEERIEAMLAEQTKELGSKASSCIRRVERKEGYPRPDLSYPAPKTE